MAKKQFFAEDEVPIFENRNGAVVFRRGENWQFRVWLTADNKYVQKSLHTKIRETAIERGQALYLELHAHIERGVKYYSISLCPSSKLLGRLSLFCNGGSGSSGFDVKPLGVDGLSGGYGSSVS